MIDLRIWVEILLIIQGPKIFFFIFHVDFVIYIEGNFLFLISS